LRQERRVERAPVDADADRFCVGNRALDDGREVGVPLLRTDVAGIDAVLGERRRALGVPRQQDVL